MNSISGEPPANFIRRIRFNMACKLLLDGRYSISEVSAMVGFASRSYFSTSFKKYMGCMPSDYVKKQRK
jgi:AraC-like DNA-binding protein